MNEVSINKPICNWRGQVTEIIWIHGHGQCKFCGTNIDECCRGETCSTKTSNALEEKSVSKNTLSKK